MRILITNDDGLNAPGLVPLIKWCQKLGEVTTFVPKYEQSGKSHGIEFHKPFEVKEVELEDGIKVYSVDSTPADCVRYALLGMKLEFDLIISGINQAADASQVTAQGLLIMKLAMMVFPLIAIVSAKLPFHQDFVKST